MPTKLLVKSYEFETGESSSLGEGTYSKVRLCTDRETGRKVAIKIMSVEQLREERAEAQVRREVSIARILDHPNVVKMYDFIDDGKNLYVVLDYVDGGDVLRMLTSRGGSLPEDEARRIFQQLIVGLRYCHVNHHIAHRDLKPENMLIDKSTRTIKISDFGLANVARATDGNGPAAELMQTVCGTATYQAPEVLKEQGYNGMTADVWSCGVILFQLLAGELPFDDENIPSLYNKIERADYRFPRGFPEGAKDLISKILIPDPSRRFTLDHIIRHPWFAVGFNEADLAVGNVCPPPSDAAVAAAVSKVAPVATPGSSAASEDAFALVVSLLTPMFSELAKDGVNHQNSKRFNFTVRGDLAGTKSAITAALTSMNPNKVTVNEKGSNATEIKGFRAAAKGLLTFNGTLTPTICPNITLVTISAGRGDLNDFETLCRSLVGALGPIASNITTSA